MKRSNVDTILDEFGHIGFIDPTLIETVKELGKTLVFLSKGAWWGCILSGIAALIAICQLVFVVC